MIEDTSAAVVPEICFPTFFFNEKNERSKLSRRKLFIEVKRNVHRWICFAQKLTKDRQWQEQMFVADEVEKIRWPGQLQRTRRFSTGAPVRSRQFVGSLFEHLSTMCLAFKSLTVTKRQRRISDHSIVNWRFQGSWQSNGLICAVVVWARLVVIGQLSTIFTKRNSMAKLFVVEFALKCLLFAGVSSQLSTDENRCSAFWQRRDVPFSMEKLSEKYIEWNHIFDLRVGKTNDWKWRVDELLSQIKFLSNTFSVWKSRSLFYEKMIINCLRD